MDYFKIDLSSINAGLHHQIGNFITIIRYCYLNNKKLIKPIFKLDKKHNLNIKKNIKSDLSMYINIDTIKVDNKPFKLYDDSDEIDFTVKRKKYKFGLIKYDELFANMKPVNIEYEMVNDIIETGKIISKKLGNNYMCVHVRRGDKLKKHKMIEDTEPENIKKVIDKYNKNVVYIMTNKIQEINKIVQLEKEKKINFFYDFEELKKIKDNYYLYCIELEIMKNASLRCSTFNTKKKDKNSIYHDYLTNFMGWQ